MCYLRKKVKSCFSYPCGGFGRTCSKCIQSLLDDETYIPGGGGGGGAAGAAGGSIILKGAGNVNATKGTISASGGVGGAGGLPGRGFKIPESYYGGKGGNGFKGRDGAVRLFEVDI